MNLRKIFAKITPKIIPKKYTENTTNVLSKPFGKNAFANKRENRYTKRIERRWKGMDEMTEKEMKSIKMSTLYELRLLFTQGEKTNYTKEEIVELLDKIASAKEQE